MMLKHIHMQFNPDREMVQCVFCDRFFHASCLGAALGVAVPGDAPIDCQLCKDGYDAAAAAAAVHGAT